MKLKSLKIENFKAFGRNSQPIPIKPLTLVFGPNSAGKSSLLHSLLWLNHAVLRGETDVYHPTLSGQSVNLGGFDSCMNRNTITDHLKYSIEVNGSHLQSKNLEKPRWIDSISGFTLTFVIRRPSKDQIPRLSAFKLLGDDVELLTAWSSTKDKMGDFFSKINFEHPAMPFASSADEFSAEQLASINSHGTYDLHADDFLPSRMELNFLSELLVVVDCNSNFKQHLSFLVKEFPSSMIGLFSDLSAMIREIQYLPPLRVIPDRSMDIRSCELPGWRSLGKRPDLLNKVNESLKLLKFEHSLQLRKQLPADGLEKVFSEFVSQAEAGRNLGALSDAMQVAREEWESLGYQEKRIWLETHPEFFQKMITAGREMIDDWSSYFEENPDKSDEEGDQPSDEWFQKEAIRQAWTFLDDWSSNGTYARFYNDAFRLHVSENPRVRAAMAEAFSERHMKDLIDSKVERIEPRLYNSKNDLWMALQDVGVGTSQVLPIVIEAYAQKDKLIAIEQPELHLHPALQAELGDVFIESALGENKNTFLLETHSEHLLLRIMKRMRQTAEGKLSEGMPPVRPEDVALLFVSPDQDGSVVQDIGLNERGELIKAWPGGFFEEGFNEMFD
jgi:predicted ATPase